jgi:CTP-dependent riboflavin kinase
MKFTIRIVTRYVFDLQTFEIFGDGQRYVYTKGYVIERLQFKLNPDDYVGGLDTRLGNFAKRFHK